MKISSGVKKRPYFLVIYGVDSVGKTTFAAEAPHAIILGPEQGSSHLNVNRFEDIKNWDDVITAMKYLRDENHDYESVGLDSLDWMEPLLWAHICKEDGSKTIAEAQGGYGKGYEYALLKWAEFIKLCEELRDKRGMNVIAIAHAHVKSFNDPNQQLPYDRYQLKLHDKAAAKWREAVDAVMFANFEDSVFKVNKNDKKAKATGGETRKLYTQRRAAYDAKNRLGLPSELDLSWSEFDRLASAGNPDSEENIKNELAELSVKMKMEDKDRMLKAVELAGRDIYQLQKIRNHARVLVGE